ncbi:Hypothetical protein R9X50_00305800 [Acrodontium crateriforme]|uniref:PQ loop repeat protein n=1 Tax=Acrodontium crateriforme TaxID=150365 RepID=A0AAQ3M2L2_9PEZI|nr:Hypothetical protein R9X50_00305800 [Acrodontium crateriforme]
MDVPIAANTLGVLGAVCWSVQLIPQIVLNYRRNNATGLQPQMMMLWSMAGIPLGVYNIVSDFNIALQIQPQILTFLSLTTWIQCYYYESKWSIPKALTVVIPIACIMAGVEVALVYALRIGVQHETRWPITLMAVLAATFLALGVLRHYWDVYVYRTVRGISFLFVGIDAMGDLTSLLSILFQPRIDILGLVIYGVELTLWLGIFACGGYYNLMPWIRRKMESRHASDTTSDENENAQRHAGVALHDLPSSTSVFRTLSEELRIRRRQEDYVTS